MLVTTLKTSLRNINDTLSSDIKQEESDAMKDLGFGDKVGRKPGSRLINHDGSFNVERTGDGILAPYQSLVEMKWPRFLLLVFLVYVSVNLLFGLGFVWIGVDKLGNIELPETFFEQLVSAFFFSVQTFTTVGYGAIYPTGVAANLLASLVALTGLLGVALATGLVFARFSQPRRQIRFSQYAIVAPYQENITSLQFRIASLRGNNLFNVRASVVLSWLEPSTKGKELKRQFAPLALERDNVSLFPLNWTIVHPIDKSSPFFNWSEEDCRQRHCEVLIMIEGYDQTYAQIIHANSSYTYEEILWNQRFKPMFREKADRTILYLDKIDAIWEEE